MIAVHAAAPGGLPQRNPVRRPVTGTAESFRIHQCLQQQRPVAVQLLPVPRQLARAPPQNLAGQSLHPHPGQDEEAAVVDDVLQVARPLAIVPADPSIARQLPRDWEKLYGYRPLLLETLV